MAKRRFNWILAIVLIIAVAVLAITAWTLREYQINLTRSKALDAGLKAYDENMWEKATINLGRYLSAVPNDISVLSKYATAQLNIRPLKHGNIQQAIAAYRSILRINKTDLTATEKLVGLYLQMNIPAEAELIAERYLRTNSDPKIRTMLAMSLAEQRKFKETSDQLQTILEEHPEEITAYEILGQLTEKYPEDFPSSPKHWFDEGVKKNPSSAQALIARSGFLLRKGDTSGALADMEKAEQLDLSDTLIHIKLAAEFAGANAFDKARKHLAEIQSKDPTNQSLWQTQAKLALRTMSKKEMLKVAQTGLKELASQPWDFMPLATELFIRCNELDPARDCIDKLKQKDTEPAEIAFLQGLLAQSEKQDHKAILFWRHAIQLGDKSAKTRLALAAALSRAGDNQSAILQLQTLIAEQPYLYRGHLDLARLLSQTGNWAEAAEQAYLAIQLAPQNLEPAFLYIQARMQLIESSQAGTDSQAWQEIEHYLNELQNLTSNEFAIRLLKFQLALYRGKFADAEQLLKDLKTDKNSGIEVAIAEIDILVAQEKVDQAISKLYVLAEQFPQNILPVKYLSVLLARRQNKEDCEKVLKDAIKRIEDVTAKRELGLLLVTFCNQWEKNNNSYQPLQALSQQLPFDIPIKLQLLQYDQVTKDLNQTQQIINDIKSIEGENGWQWRFAQANIWINSENFKNHYPQIITLLKENMVLNPDDQKSRTLLAKAYDMAGELQLAAATYQQALNYSPEDINIIVPTVTSLYKVKEYEQADKILDQAAQQKLAHPQISKMQLESCLRQGRLSSAENILEDLLAKYPNDQSILLPLALLKMRQNKYDQAQKLLDNLKAQEPNSLPVTTALIELNVRQKKRHEALALCDNLIKQHGNASAYILRGKTRVMFEENDLAKEDFEQAISIEPNNIQAWVFKSDFNRSIGEMDAALEDIQKALVLDPENVHTQERAISLLLSSDQPDKIRKGRKLLDMALSSNPHDIKLRLHKAASMLANQTAPEIKNAQEILQEITEEQPKIADAWAIWAQIYLKQDRPEKATDIVLRGLTYSPEDRTLLFLKAKAEAARTATLAIPTLKLINEREPNNAVVALELANTYIAAVQYDQAITLLQNLLTHCKKNDHRKINTALAVALYKKGDKAQAEKKFNSLYTSTSNDGELFIVQTELLKNDKNWELLKEKINDWFKRNPDDTDTFIAIAKNLAATKSDSSKKIAEDLLRSILATDPNCPPAIYTLAMILQANGRTVESARLYHRLLEIDPANVIAMNNLAWIMCEEQGKYQQALELT